MTTPPPQKAPLGLSRNGCKTHKGFSLVEVALALGVVSVALISLLGMMPIGLSTFRDSMHATVQADVLRKLNGQFLETPFSQLKDSTSMLYFSDESVEVADRNSALLGVTYTVSTNTALLGGGSAGYSNSFLKTVLVRFYTKADLAKGAPTASITNVVYVPPGVN